MLKRLLLIACCFLAAPLLYSFTFSPKQQVIKTIVIDAGHGIMNNGGYNGAKGSYSYEDEICYEISKKLVAQIARLYPEVRIVETRPTRSITDLRTRADMANANKGDLFISIHVNAAPPRQGKELTGYKTETYYTGKGKSRKKRTRKVAQYRYYSIPNTAKGTQTYIWGAHKTEDKEVAIRENAPMFAEEDYEKKYGKMDVNSPEFIALSLVKTKQFFKRSSTLASLVEEEFAKAGRISQGAYQRQTGIWVLQATAMPSILVETGFITNRSEEDYLNSESGQEESAACIARALGNYMAWVEKGQQQTGQRPGEPAPDRSPINFLEAIDKKEKEINGR